MNHNKELQASRRKWALDLLGGCCVCCGSEENLEFDHIDPKLKEFGIITYLKGRLSKLEEELAKCQLLCKSCHQNKTKREQEARRTHGTQYVALKLKCVCEVCLAAKDEYNANRREERTGSRVKKTRNHGTYAMYKHGCKCRDCKDANNRYVKELKERLLNRGT